MFELMNEIKDIYEKWEKSNFANRALGNSFTNKCVHLFDMYEKKQPEKEAKKPEAKNTNTEIHIKK